MFLHHGVGVGKTRTALGIARALGAQKVLVLAPPVALGVWERELATWQPGVWSFASLREAIELPQGPLLAATNYEQLLNPRRLKALQSVAWELLILDESHYVKNPHSRRTKAVQKLAAGIPRRLLLSGTPTHGPLDYWSQYRLIAPDDPVWAQKFNDYRAKVSILGGPNNTWITGYRQHVVEQIVQENVLPYTDVVPTSVLQLPAPLESPVPLTIGREHGVYQALKQDLIAYLDSGETVTAAHVLTKLLRLQQITSGFVTNDEGRTEPVGTTKLDACCDLVAEREGKRIVIACNYTWEIEQLKKRLPYGTAVIDGRTPLAERTFIEQDFQAGSRPIVLLQDRAGGIAITLSKADALILFSLSQSVIQDEQMRGRVWRPGQTGHVQILPLLIKGTLDMEQYAGLRVKRDISHLAHEMTLLREA